MPLITRSKPFVAGSMPELSDIAMDSTTDALSFDLADAVVRRLGLRGKSCISSTQAPIADGALVRPETCRCSLVRKQFDPDAKGALDACARR